MKRDMDLIRELLLTLENIDSRINKRLHFQSYDELSHYENEKVVYHYYLLADAGFLDGMVMPTQAMRFSKLTWKGHDFLDSVRDPEIWSHTKEGALAAGGWTLELLGDLAKGFLKKKITEKTGIDL